MDRIIKINGWPQAAVAIAGLLAITGCVWALVHADVPFETILGAVLALAGISGGQLVIARRTGSVEAKNDDQSTKLDTIVAQTNGLSDAERDRLVADAADAAAVRVIDAYRRGAL